MREHYLRALARLLKIKRLPLVREGLAIEATVQARRLGT
jgi:hypothetical protein